MSGWRRLLSYADNLLLAVVVAAGGVWGYHRLEGRDHASLPDRAPGLQADTNHDFDALARLAVLEVRPSSDVAPGYDRQAFGQRWADVDRNGCDTRNDVLGRDLSDVTFKPGTRDCVVLTGTLVDPYSGKRIEFTKPNATAVQIDHVVALADAWRKGAADWSDETRLRFANDPRNLLAVSEAANRAKGDKDASVWVPADDGAACNYVARQIEVKLDYHLWVTTAERDAMREVLTSCS